jgi:cytochrome b-561
VGAVYYANLYSLHSWIGIIAVILFCQNYLLGVLHFILPALPIEVKKMYMPLHVVLGQVTLVCAVMAIETGNLLLCLLHINNTL